MSNGKTGPYTENTRLIQSTSSLIETHHFSVHFFRFLPFIIFPTDLGFPVAPKHVGKCVPSILLRPGPGQPSPGGSILGMDLSQLCHFHFHFPKKIWHFFVISIFRDFRSVSLPASCQNVWPWRQSHWCPEHPNWAVP